MTEVKKIPKLTKRQKVFCDEYAKTQNGTQACKKAYNIGGKHGTNNPDKVAGVVACEILKKPSVRAELAKKFTAQDITADFVLSKLAEDTQLDMRAQAPAVRTKSLELLGKYLKLFTEKQEHAIVDFRSIAWGDNANQQALPAVDKPVDKSKKDNNDNNL
ncbi:MAG: terminase small subunit [Paludibacteraceae bacterium]|nr:terminase small subunit [Paludibacteraceae bacterium]